MRGLYQTWGDVTGSDPGTDGTIDPGANSSHKEGSESSSPSVSTSCFERDPLRAIGSPWNGTIPSTRSCTALSYRLIERS
jgi:hypothetical protein